MKFTFLNFVLLFTLNTSFVLAQENCVINGIITNETKVFEEAAVSSLVLDLLCSGQEVHVFKYNDDKLFLFVGITKLEPSGWIESKDVWTTRSCIVPKDEFKSKSLRLYDEESIKGLIRGDESNKDVKGGSISKGVADIENYFNSNFFPVSESRVIKKSSKKKAYRLLDAEWYKVKNNVDSELIGKSWVDGSTVDEMKLISLDELYILLSLLKTPQLLVEDNSQAAKKVIIDILTLVSGIVYNSEMKLSELFQKSTNVHLTSELLDITINDLTKMSTNDLNGLLKSLDKVREDLKPFKKQEKRFKLLSNERKEYVLIPVKLLP